MDKHSILVVDDHRDIAEPVRLYLEECGYRVFVAHDGLEALRLARQKQPDLILLDLLLPKLDGLEVCRILRAESDVPIILLTARAIEADVLLGLKLGADGHIAKPFDLQELGIRVQTVLGQDGGEVSQSQLETSPSKHTSVGKAEKTR